MDVGVGAVMFATGLTARKVRESIGLAKTNIMTDIYLTIKSNIVVLIAGSIRFVMLKDINYHVILHTYLINHLGAHH